MNVKQIRQRIFDQMDYFPDLQQYRDSIVRRMNDRYQEVNDGAHWLYLQKELDIQLRKKVSGSSTVSVYPLPANLRVLIPTGFTPTIEMEGQIITDGNGNVFDIIRVQIVKAGSGLASLGIVVDTVVIFVEPKDDGTSGGYDSNFTSGSPDTGFAITFPRVQLPDDCIEVLGITDRSDDRGRLLQIDRKREEYAYLDRDNTGTPSVAIDDEFILDPAPTNAPTLTVSALVSSTLLTNTKYEYKYTLLREGRESPPSPIAQATTGSTASQIALTNLDDVRWNTGSGTMALSGIGRVIYRRDVTNDGPWILVNVIESDENHTDTLLTPNEIGYYHKTSVVYYYSSNEDIVKYNDPGPYQFLRFWYVPDTDQKITIRYHRRPRDLQADNDVPEWPRHYHQLLVYMTLQDLFLQMQETTQSQLFAGRGMQLLEQMRRRFLARDDTRKRFMRWDRPRRVSTVYGQPTTNFTGGN